MSRTLWIALVLGFFILSSCNQTEHSDPLQDHSEPHGEHGVPTISLIILFLFGGLLYGGMLKQVNKKTGIPYTPMLFISGVLFGKFSSYLSYFGQAVQTISEINPHGILMIFLPILIFESGFNADWHIFKKQFGQTFILAFPCVFLGSLLIMLSIKLIIKYPDDYYTWAGAFMFGSILSCTDTVAVLALLKEIGAPKKFNSLIEGESLLNDGSCMVLFQISSELVKSHPITFFDIISLFLSLTLGGTVLGILFAIVSTYWIRRIFNDGILVVNITIISCYMVYFIAENVDIGIKVSGIIALVSLGLYMAAFGKTRISSEVDSYVEGFWSYAVFCAETIIFVLAGILVGTKVFTIASHITEDDLYKLLILYVCMVFARFISIAFFMRVLPHLGYGLTWKEVYVLTYGGLRGAIGISFSLIVFNDSDYSKQLRDIILFDMAGNVILTLLVNGTTTGPFVRLLGLSSDTKIKQKTYVEFLHKLLDESHYKQQAIKSELYFNEVVWSDIEHSVGRDKLEELVKKTEKTINNSKAKPLKERKKTGIDEILRKHASNQGLTTDADADFPSQEEAQTLIELRSKFLKALKTQFWQFLETNNTSAQAAVILIEAVNWDLDSQTQQMNSWQWIKAQISQSYIKFLFVLRGYSCVGRYARNYLFNYVAYSYDIVSSYIEGMERVRKKAQQFAAKESVMRKVYDESLSNQKRAEEFLEGYLNASFPEISKEIQTKKAAFNLLEYSKDILARYLKTGQLDSQEYQTLKDKIDNRAAALQLHVPHWRSKDLLESVRDNHIFDCIPDSIFKQLDMKGQMPLTPFDQQQTIIKCGSLTKYIYFIRRGIATIEYQTSVGPIKQKVGVASMIGVESIMSQKYRSACVAEAMVIAHTIKASSLIKLFNCFPEFEAKFWIQYFPSFLLMFVDKSNQQLFPLLIKSKEQIAHISKSLEFNRMEPGKVEFKCLSILLKKQLDNPEPIKLIQPNTSVEILQASSFLVDRRGVLKNALSSPSSSDHK